MSSDDRKAYCLNDDVTKTGLVNALDFIHKTIEEHISTANANQTTQEHVDDCRKTEGFVESCRLLASFSVHNSLESEAKALVQLTRNGSACFAETISNEEGLLKGFQLIPEITSVFETLDLAIWSLECATEDENNLEPPFKVWLDSDQSSEAESIIFYPSQWNPVATKEYEDGWDSIGGFFTNFGDEVLHTDDSKSRWIVIRSQYHNDCPGLGWHTYYYLTASNLSQWLIDSEAIPPYSLDKLIQGKILTPDGTHAELTRKVSWNGKELFVGGKFVTKFATQATRIRPILDAFQEEGWPEKIYDPLPGDHDDPWTRVRDVVRDLNEKQAVIHFSSLDRGESIKWEFRVSSVGDNSTITPTENT